MNGSTVYLRVDTYGICTGCYILEKVIIERNADLKRPFNCKRNPETFFREKSNVCWKDRPRQNPTLLIRTRLRQRRGFAWQKNSKNDSDESKRLENYVISKIPC